MRAFLSRPLQAARLLLASGEDVDPLLLDEVRQAIVAIMADQRVSIQARIEAGTILGQLGDPRCPVDMAQWQAEPFPATFGNPPGYWCALPEGTYKIGGWEQSALSAEIALPAFWIARFPITVAQYAPFVEHGYAPDAERWWTPHGWAWKLQEKREQARHWWNEPNFSRANQPVSGVTWYEAMAFCAWLTKQIGDMLPAGYQLCLPTEAEWEVAAAYDVDGQRRTYPWGEATPTLDRAVFGRNYNDGPWDVGSRLAGAAACGALEMVGTVWEHAASSYRGYPNQGQIFLKDFTTSEFDVSTRGGAYYSDSTPVRCGARLRFFPVSHFDVGFRIVVAPRLAR